MTDRACMSSSEAFIGVLARDAAERTAGEGSLLHRLVGSSHGLASSEAPSSSGDVAEGETLSVLEARRRSHQEAMLHAQLTRERLAKMEAVLKEAEPTLQKIPLYVEKLRLIGRSMRQIEETVGTMRREVGEVYASSGLEKQL